MSALVWDDLAVRRALGLRTDLAEEGRTYTGVSTDSRTVEPGALYVALVGERFDGHDFVADALARGAAGAVVSRPVPAEPGVKLYPVDDTLAALGRLAAYRRRALTAPVVAITGSSGKTTTKDLTRGALEGALRVHATRGNLNNRIGMPLTLLETPADAQVVVLELGTNEPGEIRTLTEIARPDVGVITTVGESHLEKLGSLEGVMEEKLDLLRGLAGERRAVVGDEPAELPRRAREIVPDVRVAGWTEAADADLRPAEVEADVFGGTRFRWRGQTVHLQIPGRHAVADALLALAVSEFLGVDARSAARGVSAVPAAGMRSEIRRLGDLTLIVDCYNANPQSVRAALDVLEAHGAASRTVAVLGTMLELGTGAPALHREVLADALRREIDVVVATGAFAEAAGELGAAGERLLVAPDWAAAYPELRSRLRGDEVVLLKASRGVRMEELVERLEADLAVANGAAGEGEG